MSIYSLRAWMMLHKADSVLMMTSESSVRRMSVWHTGTLRTNAVCDFRSDAVLADISVRPDFSAAVPPAGAAVLLL